MFVVLAFFALLTPLSASDVDTALNMDDENECHGSQCHGSLKLLQRGAKNTAGTKYGQLLQSFETLLQGLDDSDLYGVVDSVMAGRPELQTRLMEKWRPGHIAPEAPGQKEDVQLLQPDATTESKKLEAHQDFVFTLLGVKTTRQKWTKSGDLPNKTLNVAVKFRVVHGAGEPYASCVVMKKMGKGGVECDINSIGGLNGSSQTGVNNVPYPWYNLMYDIMVEDYLTPTKELPQQIYWEVVNLAFAQRLMLEFDGTKQTRPKIIGVSTLMQVDGTAQTATPHSASIPGLQPGNHGTVVNIGEIDPLDYNVLSFSNVYRGTFPSDTSVAPEGSGWMSHSLPEKGPAWTASQPK